MSEASPLGETSSCARKLRLKVFVLGGACCYGDFAIARKPQRNMLLDDPYRGIYRAVGSINERALRRYSQGNRSGQDRAAIPSGQKGRSLSYQFLKDSDSKPAYQA